MEPFSTLLVASAGEKTSISQDLIVDQALSVKGEIMIPDHVSHDVNNLDASRVTLCHGTLDDKKECDVTAPQAHNVSYRGHENAIGGWGGYSQYINVESIGGGSMGVYNEKLPVMFHTGYGYSPHHQHHVPPPYGPYSPATSPLPTSASGDHGFSQQFSFSGPYSYHHHYTPSPPPLHDISYSVSQPDLAVPIKHQVNYAGNHSGLYDTHQGGYDGLGSSAEFWLDLLNFPDGARSVTPLFSPGASPQPAVRGPFGQGSTGLAIQRQKYFYGSGSSICPHERGGYYHGGMYHQGYNYGGYIPSSSLGSNAVEKEQRWGKGNISLCNCNVSLDFLNEQNRGPRSTRPKIVSTEQNIPDDNNKISSTAQPNHELFNREDFSTDYKNAKFFIIKSYSEDNVHKSVKYGVWASTANGNRKLDSAYHEAKEKGGGSCPVFLFFSVNASAQFCGVAEMIGPVDFDKNVDYWQQDKWNGRFPVKWHIIKDVPNNLFRHIILDNNDNKPVTNSRDTQEVKLEHGLEMLRILKQYEGEMSILDDFKFYEERQKAMQDRKSRQLLLSSAVVSVANSEVSSLSANGDNANVMDNGISKTFAQVVRIQENKNQTADKSIPSSSTSAADHIVAAATTINCNNAKAEYSKKSATSEVIQNS